MRTGVPSTLHSGRRITCRNFRNTKKGDGGDRQKNVWPPPRDGHTLTPRSVALLPHMTKGASQMC